MPRPRHSGVLVIAAVIATGAVGAYAATGSGGTSQSGPLALSGSVSALVPGAHRTIEVEVTNPNGREATVTEIAVAVTAEQAGCPASALEVGRADTPLTVPAAASRTTSLPVTLVATAPDACQGASFALRYSATATGPDLPAAAGGETPAAAPGAPATRLVTKTVLRTKRVCRVVRHRHRRVKRCRKVRVKVRIKVRVPA